MKWAQSLLAYGRKSSEFSGEDSSLLLSALHSRNLSKRLIPQFVVSHRITRAISNRGEYAVMPGSAGTKYGVICDGIPLKEYRHNKNLSCISLVELKSVRELIRRCLEQKKNRNRESK